MGKGEELLVAQRNPIMGQFPAQKQKQINKLSNLNNGQSPRSKEQIKQNRQYQLTQKHFLDENHIQHDEKSASNVLYQNGKYQNNHFQTQSRKPLQDITNVSNSKQSSKKSFANETQAIKQTRHFTYLTFLNSSALKQFKVLLYVDRELGIPQEYVDKLQDHSIDNDVATDDEQIISATRKLKSALEEEVYMNRDLEEDLLEQIMYEEIEKWESEEDIRKQEQKQQSLIDYEMLMKNQQIADTKHKFSIDQLYERIYIKYQSKCKKPFSLKSHERLLYKTIEKTVPKFKEYFKNQSFQYKQYLQKKQQKNLKQQQQQQQVQQQQQSQIQQQQQIQLQLQQQQQQQQQMQLQQQIQNEHNSNYVKQKQSSSSSNSMMEQISNVSTQPSHISENSYINSNQCNLNEITTKVHGSNSNNFEVLSDVSSLHKISSSNLIDSV